MCKSGAEDGHRCADHVRSRAVPIEDLWPDSVLGRPDVEWASDPASTAERLYKSYPSAVAAVVVDLMAGAKAQEAAMTTEMIESMPAGTRMHGLDFRMKSPDSLARKINDRWEASPSAEPEQIAARISDIVRYTAIAPPDRLVAVAGTAVDALTSRGWTVVEVEHSYIDGSQYKGLHMLARHSSGRVAELQFHTKESQQVKDETHVGYERMRDPNTPRAERVELSAKGAAAWDQVPVPDGLADLATLGGCTVTQKHYATPTN